MTHHLHLVPVLVMHFLNPHNEPKEVKRFMPVGACHTLAPQAAMLETLKDHPDWTPVLPWVCTFDDGHKDA